uniref:Maturase K n=1 Tax=Tmesipteris elongata TaxID=50272 RepID=A0A059U7G7_TMEEL|nr:maturase K [Tmesipteris elongata]
MRTINRILDKIGKVQKGKRRLFWPLYPLLFRDDLYAIAYNRFSSEFSLKSMKHRDLSDRYSLIRIKRLINRIRNHTASWLLFQGYDQKNLTINRSLFEGLTVLLEMIIPVESQPLVQYQSEWNSIQSIHSIFLFMEDRFFYSNSILGLKIPYYFHPELIIRLFRRRIKDVFFLHLVRLLFHNYQNPIVPDVSLFYSLEDGKKRLSILLWNHYFHEFENQLVPLWKRFVQLQSIYDQFLIDKTYPLYKMKSGLGSFKPFLSEMSLVETPCIHYVRYENHSIIAFKGTKSLVDKWIKYLFGFWQYNYHYWLQPCQIYRIRPSSHCFSFLGYILGFRSRMIKVHTKMIDESSITHCITKEFCSGIPTSSLIESLTREGFCDSSGRPVGRSAWTILTDDEILKKYHQIWRDLFCYYSGSFSRDGLWKAKYILQLSCAKTLAHKHKSTTRRVRNQFGSKFMTEFNSVKNPFLICSQEYSHRKNFWCLDIIRMNSLVNFIHTGKKKSMSSS